MKRLLFFFSLLIIPCSLLFCLDFGAFLQGEFDAFGADKTNTTSRFTLMEEPSYPKQAQPGPMTRRCSGESKPERYFHFSKRAMRREQ